MNVHDLFPSRYITAADLNGGNYTLTIKSVVMEDMQSHDNKKVTKPVVRFANAQKSMVLNRTNCMIIAALYGDETDGWAGKRIAIYPTQVRAFGKMQDCIRVKEEIPALPKPVAQAPSVEERAEIDDDEDVADYDDDAASAFGDQIWEPDGNA